jgi:hypothetical protein
MPRARILAAAEQEAFDSPPAFTALERKKHFALSETVRSLVDTLQTPTNRVCFLVTLAYFRATRKFFGHQFHPGTYATRLGSSESTKRTSMSHGMPRVEPIITGPWSWNIRAGRRSIRGRGRS